jgi:glutathione S-transferase
MTSASDITLYAYPFRSRAERVIWALNELELDFRLERLDPFKGDNRKKSFLKLNPGGKIPVLVHGENIVSESLAIMQYLDTIATGPGLVPQNTAGATRYSQLMYFMMSEIESYLWIADQATRLNRVYQWPDGTAAVSVERASTSMPILYQQIEAGEYLVNEKFSVADIYAYHLVTWARTYQISTPDSVIEYLRRMQNRPGCPESIKPAEKKQD